MEGNPAFPVCQKQKEGLLKSALVKFTPEKKMENRR